MSACSPLSALRSPLSALRSPLSALRSPLSALRSPLSALRSPLSDSSRRPLPIARRDWSSRQGPHAGQLFPWALVFLAVGTLTPSTAAAEVFAPVNCTGSPAEVDFSYISHGAGGDHPSDPYCDPGQSGSCPSYIPNIDHHRYFIGNHYTHQVDLRFPTFGLEPSYDYFQWGQLGYSPTSNWTGYHDPNSWMTGASFPGSYEQTPGKMRFISDVIIGYGAGFKIDRARVTCQTVGTSAVHTLENGARYSGVMLGTNDTIFARFPSESSHHITLSMWAETGAGRDFDIYVRCGAFPTPTTYDQRAISGQNEFIHIGAGTCSSSTMWYMAINSYSGSGWFNLVKARHKASQHRSIRVGANYNISASYPGGMPGFGSTLQKNVRTLFGMSEGTQYIENIDYYQNVATWTAPNGQDYCALGGCGGVDCDVCYQSPQCCDPFNDFQIVVRSSGLNSSTVLAHEMGHRWMGQNDEYLGNNATPRCGHTMMADWTTDNYNLCTGEQGDGTVFADHTLDRKPGSTADPHAPGWQTARTSGASPDDWIPRDTPDNYSYANFDFDNKLGILISH